MYPNPPSFGEPFKSIDISLDTAQKKIRSMFGWLAKIENKIRTLKKAIAEDRGIIY
jgi:hypothetical protein